MKIMKILQLHENVIKIKKNEILCENHEHHEILNLFLENHENY